MEARRLLVPALAALALLAPAAARADDALNRGADKLGERASAECRRAGVQDCYSGRGRQVIRSKIDAYQQSWLHRTVAFQSRLGDPLPFADAPWVGTHNSFNSTDENPTASHTDSNQQLSLTDQLRLDVRSLELDVHWLPARGAVVCHGQGNVGCSTERTLAERLSEVATWVKAHPGEVLLLYLEDQIDDPAGYEASAKIVGDAFGSKLYRPRGGGCQNLPLTLTRDAVRAAGAQVVVVGDCGTGAWQTVSHAWPGDVRFEERPHGYKPCPADPYDKLVRYYEDSTWLSEAGAPSGQTSPDDGLTADTVRAMLRCGVDLLGFDQLLPGDDRLDALAWSWAEGEPKAGAGDCTVAGERWSAAACGERHRAACRSASGAWSVPSPSVPRTGASGVCADRGLTLATPRTASEHARLRAAAGTAAVWLALKR